MRGKGQTTGLALKFLGDAMTYPGETMNFKDHHRTHAADSILFHTAIDIVYRLKLKGFRFSTNPGYSVVYTQDWE